MKDKEISIRNNQSVEKQSEEHKQNSPKKCRILTKWVH